MKREDCLFELIYLKKEEDRASETSIGFRRVELGRLLAKKCPVEDDSVVVPVPETAILFAQGYSLELNIPFIYAIFKKRPKVQTLFIKDRKKVIENAFFVVPELVKNKKIALIDETIISGLSLSITIQKLKEAEPKEIHVRIIAPMRRRCPRRDFVEPWTSIKDISNYVEYFQVDSFEFLDDETLRGLASCVHCFEGGQK